MAVASSSSYRIWLGRRMFLLRLREKTWLIDIGEPALQSFDCPRGLFGIQSFAVLKRNLYVAFDGSRVVAFSENGTTFDYDYDCNVTNVELVGDAIEVTWWPGAQGRWRDRIDLATGVRVRHADPALGEGY
jgi:hypothetical protein